MNDLREAFYDRCGNVWQPSKNGYLLTCLKKMPRTAKLAEIPGEHGFFAHVDGHVFTAWSGRGKGKSKQKYSVKELHLVVPVDGHVNLYNRVLRLDEVMLETFVGPCPENHELTHLDGDIENCDIENLRWRNTRPDATDEQ